VLSRDNFRCRYCWANWDRVELEVDHVIPVSKWWSDDMDNLATSCRRCNMGKGYNIIKDDKSFLKQMVSDYVEKSKRHFYLEWNKRSMWNVWHSEYAMLMIYLKTIVYWNTWEDYFSWYNMWPESNNMSHEEMVANFKKCWDYTRVCLDSMLSYIIGEVDDLVDTVYDDTVWNSDRKWEYSDKLNYQITEVLTDCEVFYIKKYTLYPNLMSKNA